MSSGFYLDVNGLGGMQRDFSRLEAREPMPETIAKMDAALASGFAATQAAVPVDEGDDRRPAGSLKAPGRATSYQDLDTWHGEIAYGSDDDVMPYAVWAEWKHFDETGVDYMEGAHAAVPAMDRAVDEYFTHVFPDAEERR